MRICLVVILLVLLVVVSAAPISGSTGKVESLTLEKRMGDHSLASPGTSVHRSKRWWGGYGGWGGWGMRPWGWGFRPWGFRPWGFSPWGWGGMGWGGYGGWWGK